MTEEFSVYRVVEEEDRQRLLGECRHCLAPVTFPRYPGARSGQMPPVEEAGLVYIRLTDGSAVRTMSYRIHECSGERPIDPETGEVMLSKEEARRVNQERSILRPCPKCRAYIGERCINMTRTKGPSVPTAWPHEERLEP